jgi:hypothetical protein
VIQPYETVISFRHTGNSALGLHNYTYSKAGLRTYLNHGRPGSTLESWFNCPLLDTQLRSFDREVGEWPAFRKGLLSGAPDGRFKSYPLRQKRNTWQDSLAIALGDSFAICARGYGRKIETTYEVLGKQRRNDDAIVCGIDRPGKLRILHRESRVRCFNCKHYCCFMELSVSHEVANFLDYGSRLLERLKTDGQDLSYMELRILAVQLGRISGAVQNSMNRHKDAA